MSHEAIPQRSLEQHTDERLQTLCIRAGLDQKYHEAAHDASNHYIVNKLYHNLDHMFEVTEKVLDLFDEYGEAFALSTDDRQQLFLAALWHDADYHLPMDETFLSKEQRSARLVYDALTKDQDQDPQWETIVFAGGVASLVLSTEPGRKIKYGTAAYLLNRADLNNLTGTKEDDLLKSGKFFIEQLMAQGAQTTESAQEALEGHSDTLRKWCLSTRYHLEELVRAKQLPEITESRIHQIVPRLVKKALATLAQGEFQQDNTDETDRGML